MCRHEFINAYLKFVIAILYAQALYCNYYVMFNNVPQQALMQGI